MTFAIVLMVALLAGWWLANSIADHQDHAVWVSLAKQGAISRAEWRKHLAELRRELEEASLEYRRGANSGDKQARQRWTRAKTQLREWEALEPTRFLPRFPKRN